MGRAASLLLGCEAGAGGRRRGPGRRGLSTALPAARWFWLRGSRAAALDSEPFSAAVRGGEGRGGGAGSRLLPRAAGERRCPASSLRPPMEEAACSSREFRKPGGPGSAAAGSRPALARRPPRAPTARELGWDFPADAVCLFAEAALNFLSKLLIRYAVLCSCSVRANGSARLERLVTQGIVIREVRNISACPVQVGLYL